MCNRNKRKIERKQWSTDVLWLEIFCDICRHFNHSGTEAPFPPPKKKRKDEVKGINNLKICLLIIIFFFYTVITGRGVALIILVSTEKLLYPLIRHVWLITQWFIFLQNSKRFIYDIYMILDKINYICNKAKSVISN